MSSRTPIIGLFALAALIAACTSGTSATPAGSVGDGAASTVKVTLQEFAVLPAVAGVPAGPVTFVVNNIGPEDVHEMVVIKTDLGVRDLPVDGDGKVMEDGAGMSIIGEIEDVGIGATEQVGLELTEGKYLLICNILQTEPDGSLESHYALGMSTRSRSALPDLFLIRRRGPTPARRSARPRVVPIAAARPARRGDAVPAPAPPRPRSTRRRTRRTAGAAARDAT